MTTFGAGDVELERAVEETMAQMEATGALDEGWIRSRFPARCQDVLDTLALETRLRADWAPGSDMGPFRVLRMLGQGSTGRVYVVRLTTPRFGLESGSIIAVKAVHSHLAERLDVGRRLVREVAAGRRVRHPCVVRVHGIEELSTERGRGRAIAMELVEGESLRARLERGERPRFDECLRIARDTASGLAALHDAGIVHRDVKPENLLQRADGRVVVLDLGLARIGSDGSRVSRTGEFVGTLRYAAPEQFQPDAPPSARSDLYALGVTLFEIATGRLPWEDDEGPSTPDARTLLGPLRLADVAGSVPSALEHVIDVCLETRPDGRWTSANEVVSRLGAPPDREVASGAPIVELPSHAWRTLRDGLAEAPERGVPVFVLDWGPFEGPRLPSSVRSRLERAEPARSVVTVECPVAEIRQREVAVSLGTLAPDARTGGRDVLVVEETHRLTPSSAIAVAASLRDARRRGFTVLLTQRGASNPFYALASSVGPTRLIVMPDASAPTDRPASASGRRRPQRTEREVLSAMRRIGRAVAPAELVKPGLPLLEALQALRRLERDCGLVCHLESGRYVALASTADSLPRRRRTDTE